MKHAPSLLATLALASCASSERALRIQPFASAPGPDRVNLWPLAYRNEDELALLWPLIDFDDRGFAVRPLVAKDDTRWSILYPLSSFDAGSGEGWAGPFYKFERYGGIFPVCGFGDFSYVGPAFWKKDETGATRSGGLFPVFAFSGGFNYVGPAFWKKDETGAVASGGLFPVSAITRGFSYAGPAWWARGEDGRVESWGLFPLFGKGSVDHVGPFWRTKDEQGRLKSLGLFPLAWGSADGRELGVLPFYHHSLKANARERTFLLGLGSFRRSESRETDWVFPLWFHDERPGASDSVVAPLFYKRTRGERTHVFTLLGDRRIEGEESALNLYPLWWSSDGPTSRTRLLLPFFYYGEDGPRRTLLTPLGGRSWDASGATRYVNVLGPVFHYSASESGRDRSISFLWPLVEHSRTGEEAATRVVPLFGTTSAPEETETWFAAGLGHSRRGRSGASWRFWPLASRSSEEEVPGPLYDWTLFKSRRSHDRTETRLFPLYKGKSDPRETERSLLFGIANHRRDPQGVSWRLWPLASFSEGAQAPRGLDDLTLLGRREEKGGSHFHLGGPFVFRLDRSRSADRSTIGARVLTLFTYDALDRGRADIPTGTEASEWNLVRSRRFGFLLGAFKDETREFRVWKEGTLASREIEVLEHFSPRFDADPRHLEKRDPQAARAVLQAHGASVPEGEPGALERAIADFARRNTESRTKRHLRLPFLLSYRSEGKASGWSALLGLVRSQREPDRSKFSLLYYLFRTETRGERTTRDLFPFVTWDSGPEEVRFSFLWRLFRYEKVGGKKRGHVLFIPWGGA